MALRGANSFARTNVGGNKSLAQLKDMFFDRQRVIDAADKGTVRGLSKFGGLVRVTAQRSMRKRKKGFSQPGQPPFSKQGDLRKHLYYSWDPRTRTVVIGPLGFKNSDTPFLHEFGGVRTTRKGEQKRYPARPFMRPALDKMLPRFAEQFRGSIGG